MVAWIRDRHRPRVWLLVNTVSAAPGFSRYRPADPLRPRRSPRAVVLDSGFLAYRNPDTIAPTPIGRRRPCRPPPSVRPAGLGLRGTRQRRAARWAGRLSAEAG